MIRLAGLIGVLTCLAAPLAAQNVVNAAGAELRVLDRLTGFVTDLVIGAGQTDRMGVLSVTLGECRYPQDNVAGEAYARLDIFLRDDVTPVFSGWMLASAPALNAMDHPRYDVWVLRCMTSLTESTLPENTGD
jgi:hypothetical protein